MVEQPSISEQQSESIKTKIQYSHFILHLNKKRIRSERIEVIGIR